MADTVDFRQLFEKAPAQFMVLDTDYKIVTVTDLYARATLTETAQVVGRGIFEIFPDNPDDPSAEGVRNLRVSLDRVMRDGVSDPMPVQRYDVQRADGEFEERYWSVSNWPVFGNDGQVRFIIHRAEDVTEYLRLRAESGDTAIASLGNAEMELEQDIFARAYEVAQASRSLKESNAELAGLYARAKQLDDLKSQFFANVSHELRTPLMLILEPARKLRRSAQEFDPNYSDVELITRNAELLLRQVNNMLDAAKLEAGAVQPTYAHTDIAEQVRLGASFFESLAIDRGIQFRVVSDDALTAALDRQHLQQILVNLLSNAFKFTRAGGTVRCSAARVDDRIVIEIADSGPGIPADQRAAVFNRFHQVDASPSRAVGGTGLGLSIVRDLVGLHRGEVTIDEAPEGGALVTVELPQDAPPGLPVQSAVAVNTDRTHNDAAGAIAELTPASTGPTMHEPDAADARPVIVVIEDNADLNAFVYQALSDRYRVEAAFDGRSGFELARSHRPHLIVSDVMMPQMTGAELLAQVRADPELADTPVLMLTARADDSSRLSLLQAGANDYLAKPFPVGELHARVDNLIKLRLAEARVRTMRVADERERIALELHRTVVQRLFSIGLQLSGIQPLIRVPTVANRISDAVSDLDLVIEQISETVNQLDIPDDEMNFRLKMSELIGEVCETLGAKFQVSFIGPLDTINATIASAVYGAVQQLMSAIVDRAAATEITLRAACEADLVVVVSEIASSATDQGDANEGGLLPQSLIDLGGRLDITTPLSGETLWTWTVPVPPDPHTS